MDWYFFIALLALLVVITTLCYKTVERLTDAQYNRLPRVPADPLVANGFGAVVQTCEIDDNDHCIITKKRECTGSKTWCSANDSPVSMGRCSRCDTAIVVSDPVQNCSKRCGGGVGSQSTLVYSWDSAKGKGWEPNSDDFSGRLRKTTIAYNVKCNRQPCCDVRTTPRRPMTKKGVGVPDFYIDDRFFDPVPLNKITASGLDALAVGWYYNWNYCEDFDTAVQYVPMQYSTNNRPEIRGRYEYLLGINEPDHPCQGKLTIYDVLVPFNVHAAIPGVRGLRKLLVRQCPKNSPPESAPIQAFQVKTTNPDVSVWSEIEKSAKYIGSPACASEDAGFIRSRAYLNNNVKWALTQGTGRGWLNRFVNYSNPAFDVSQPHFNFICVHWYGNGKTAQDMIHYLEEMWEMYGRPIWITEYALQTTGDAMERPNRYTWEQVTRFMDITTEFFETTHWIHRYAWHHSYYGSSSLWNEDGTLTPAGAHYANVDVNYRNTVSHVLENRHKSVYDRFGTRYVPAIPTSGSLVEGFASPALEYKGPHAIDSGSFSVAPSNLIFD